MKNSKKYAKKIKRLVASEASPAPVRQTDLIALLVEGVLSEDTTLAKASAAITTLGEEFTDFNELRVSPLRDIVEVLGEDFPGVREKAGTITAAIQAVFDRTNSLSLEFLAKMTKREVRSLLRDEIGLSPWSESVVTLYGFGGHAMPVDDLLLEALKMGEYIHPDSDLLDLQGFLERITPGKDAISWHEALQAYSVKTAPKVARERARLRRLAQAQAKVKAKAEAKTKAKAEARAKVKAEAKAKAEAQAKAKDKKKKKVKTKTKAKAKGKAKPATKKKAKSPANTVGKKTVKKKKKAGKTVGKKKTASRRAKK